MKWNSGIVEREETIPTNVLNLVKTSQAVVEDAVAGEVVEGVEDGDVGLKGILIKEVTNAKRTQDLSHQAKTILEFELWERWLNIGAVLVSAGLIIQRTSTQKSRCWQKSRKFEDW